MRESGTTVSFKGPLSPSTFPENPGLIIIGPGATFGHPEEVMEIAKSVGAYSTDEVQA